MRRHVVALGALGIALGVSGAAALATPQEDTTTVRGTVALPDGSPAAGVEVVIEVHDGTTMLFENQVISDADGSVGWDQVPAASGNFVRLGATYDGAVYYSETTSLAPGTAPALNVPVFPLATDGRPLHIQTLHLIVQVEDPGLYRVLQFMTVVNAGEAAYAGGPQLADGRSSGLVIPIPETASAVRAAPFPSPADALDVADAEIGTDRVLDARPVPADGRQVAVTYDLVADDGPVQVKLAVPYPVQAVSLMIGGEFADTIEITETDLVARPNEEVGDQNFALWAAEGLQPGTELAFTIGKPAVTLSSQQWSLLALGIALLLAFAGAIYGGNFSHDAGASAAVAAHIAQLDLDHEGGALSSEAYFQQRSTEIERLMLLERLVGDDRS